MAITSGKPGILLNGCNHHPRQQLQRQADDVRLASLDDVHPVEAILIAEGPGLARPLAGVQIGREIAIGNWVHHEPGDFDLGPDAVVGLSPEAEAAKDAVLAAPQRLEHPPGIVAISRLAENLPAALGDRIAADNEAALDSLGHVAGLL